MNVEELFTQWIMLFEEEDFEHISFVKSAEKDNWDFVNEKTKVFYHNVGDDVIHASFMIHEKNLAIACWAIPVLLKYCLREFQELLKLDNWIQNIELRKNMKDLTSCLLCISAECYTGWNVRRKLLMNESNPNIIQKEMLLIKLALSKNPKSSATWAFRKWMLITFTDDIAGTYDKIVNEILICQRIAEVYPKNYYAWTYRQLVSDKLQSLDNVKEQLDVLGKWTKKHVSDHCAYHCRQNLWMKYVELIDIDLSETFLFLLKSDFLHSELQTKTFSLENSKCRDLFILCKEEFKFSSHLLVYFPGHEAMWCHRRKFVIFWILVIILCPSIHQLVLEDEIPTNSNNNEDDIILEDLSEIFINEAEFAKKNIYDSGISRFEVNRKSAISYLYWLSVLSERLNTSKLDTSTKNILFGQKKPIFSQDQVKKLFSSISKVTII